MFSFFLANNLVAPNQSGFKPGDSYVNQLLSITHEIYSSFDDGFEVRTVFLDISMIGPFNGKGLSIQIVTSKLKESYSAEN